MKSYGIFNTGDLKPILIRRADNIRVDGNLIGFYWSLGVTEPFNRLIAAHSLAPGQYVEEV